MWCRLCYNIPTAEHTRVSLAHRMSAAVRRRPGSYLGQIPRVNGFRSQRPQALLRKHLPAPDVPFCSTEPAGVSSQAFTDLTDDVEGGTRYVSWSLLVHFPGSLPSRRMLSFSVPWNSVCLLEDSPGLREREGSTVRSIACSSRGSGLDWQH